MMVSVPGQLSPRGPGQTSLFFALIIVLGQVEQVDEGRSVSKDSAMWVCNCLPDF
jgi:hypothetical protein